MKKLIILLFSILLFSCSNTKNVNSNKTNLLDDKVLKSDIKKYVSEVDTLIFDGKLKSETNFDIDGRPCEIVKYFKNDILIKLEVGCGDCSQLMTQDTYYLKNNDLIHLKSHYTYFGFPPCMTKEEYEGFGFTEEEIKKKHKERTDEYYFTPNLIFSRTGDLNDTNYVSNDTLTQNFILESLNEFVSIKEE